MIDQEQFERIRRKHGGYASWAVWAAAAGGPKSNIEDLSILDVVATPTMLQVLSSVDPSTLANTLDGQRTTITYVANLAARNVTFDRR